MTAALERAAYRRFEVLQELSVSISAKLDKFCFLLYLVLSSNLRKAVTEP